MEQSAKSTILRRGEAGFTLVEIMVALVILLVGMLGLVQMVGVTAASNVKNQMRDEAVLLGEEQMAELFSVPESKVVAFQTITAASRLRGSTKKYTITRKADKIPSTSSYQYVVNVGWSYKGVPSYHEVQAMRTFVNGN